MDALQDQKTYNFTGTLTVVRTDGSQISCSSTKARYILISLVIAPFHTVSRAHTCSILWPGSTLTNAKVRLRQELLVLREFFHQADVANPITISKTVMTLNMDGFTCELSTNRAQLDQLKQQEPTIENLQLQIDILLRESLPPDTHNLFPEFIKANATELALVQAQLQAVHFLTANSPIIEQPLIPQLAPNERTTGTTLQPPIETRKWKQQHLVIATICFCILIGGVNQIIGLRKHRAAAVRTSVVEIDSIITYQYQPPQGELDESEFTTLTVTKSGNIIAAGSSKAKNGRVHGLITVLGPDSKLIWSRLYGVTGSDIVEFKDVISDDTGNMFIAGRKWNLASGMWQGLVVSYNATGSLRFSAQTKQAITDNRVAKTLAVPDSNGGCWLTCTTAKQNTLLSLHIDAKGNTVKEVQNNTPNMSCVDFQATGPGQYTLLTNHETNSFPSYRQWFVTQINDNKKVLWQTTKQAADPISGVIMSSINPSNLPHIALTGLCNPMNPRVSDTDLRPCLSTVSRTTGKSHIIQLASRYLSPKMILNSSAGNQLCVALSAPAADSTLPIELVVADTEFIIKEVKKAQVSLPEGYFLIDSREIAFKPESGQFNLLTLCSNKNLPNPSSSLISSVVDKANNVTHTVYSSLSGKAIKLNHVMAGFGVGQVGIASSARATIFSLPK